MYEVGACFERKDKQYKIVAKVEHEVRVGSYVYLVAVREFGGDEVEYIQAEDQAFDVGYTESVWLGLGLIEVYMSEF